MKYHFKSDQGIETLTDQEAEAVLREDGDAHIRDLWSSIDRGDHPSWTLKMQIMPFDEAADYRFNPFDLTKIWPHEDYPLHEIGRMVLDRNPSNYFAEVEQAAFEPSNVVPGIGPSPDKMLLGRFFSYPDTHRYRIGPNYMQLPINAPKASVHSYHRDGAMLYKAEGDPVYAPNSYGGPKADPAYVEPNWSAAGEIVRSAYTKRRDDDDFVQPRALVQKVMDDTARDRLVATVTAHVSNGVTPEVRERVFDYWRKVDDEVGARIAKAVTNGG